MSNKTETSESALAPQQKLTQHGNECATNLSDAADAMHAELLRQCDDLMDSMPGTHGAKLLQRIAPLVEAYEQARWPLE